LPAVAAVSWGGAALAACAAAVVAAAVSAAAIFAAVVAAATAFARAVAARVVVAAATIAAAAVSTAAGAAAVGAPVVAPERLGWRRDALLSSQSTRLCLSFSNLLGFAVRFLDFFFLTAVLPAGVSLHVKLICCSNGNDIETKRKYASIIGLFSVSKRNEPTYSRTWKDLSEAKTNINMLCKIEEITNIISLKSAGSKRKRIQLV
jgi:hypothetical protein